MDYAAEISKLREEIEVLKGKKPQIIYTDFYKMAQQECNDYYDGVKLDGQDYGVRLYCTDMAKYICKYNFNVSGETGRRPYRYINSEETAREYVSIFKALVDTCQRYLRKEQIES